MAEPKEFWIGFDLGGTKMLGASFDESLRLMTREKKRTKASEGPDSVVERIIETIEKTIEKSDVSDTKLNGIGIGVPGPIDLKKGVIIEAPNLGWKDIPLKKILSDRFKTEVVLCNDVDAGVYGEFAAGAAKDAYCVAGIFPGTGVGGGCVFNGQLLQGKRRTAMEVGHIPFFSGGPIDGAGNQGTLESVASRLAISGASAQAVFRGSAPKLKEIAGSDVAEIKSGVLADAIKQGDKSIQQIVEHASMYIGKAVVTLVHLLGADCVVLGGGLVEAMPELVVDVANRYAQANVLSSYKDTFEVVPAKLGDDSSIVGAAAWARKEISAGNLAAAN